MVESTSTVSGPSPGPAPAAQALARTSPVTLSSWRTCPKVKLRSHVPTVEAAITRWPSTLAVDPARSSSTSSMQSPPATRAWTRVSSLLPGWAAPGRSPRSTSWSVACSIPSRSARVAGSSSPACATARGSSNAISTWSMTTWEDRIEKVPPARDEWLSRSRHPPRSGGPFHNPGRLNTSPHRWIKAEVKRTPSGDQSLEHQGKHPQQAFAAGPTMPLDDTKSEAKDKSATVSHERDKDRELLEHLQVLEGLHPELQL